MDALSYLLGKKAGGGGGGTSNYNDLSNKPSINGVTLSGNKTTSDLGIEAGAAAEITVDLQQISSSTLLEKVGELISNNIDKVVKVYVVDGSMYMSEGYIHVINLLNSYTPAAYYEGNFGTSYTTVQINGAWNNARTEYTVSSMQTTSLNIKKALPVDNTITYTPTQATHPATKGYVDSNIPSPIQYSTMPTASEDTVGKIVQYTGTTDSTYTNGYFYIGTTDGEDPATYSWENINVQASSGGSKSNLYVADLSSVPTAQKPNFWDNLPQTINNEETENIFKPIMSEILERINNGENNFLLLVKWGDINDSLIRFSSYVCLFKLGRKTNNTLDFISTEIILSPPNYYGARIPKIEYNYYTYAVTYNANKLPLLPTNNTVSYTPTSAYNPATKKYVDDQPTTYTGYDATKTQVLKNINGTLTWVDES